MFEESNISKPRRPKRPRMPQDTKELVAKLGLPEKRSGGMFNPEAQLDTSRVSNAWEPPQFRNRNAHINPLIPNAYTRNTNAVMGGTSPTTSVWNGSPIESPWEDTLPIERPQINASKSLSKQIEKLIRNTQERESFLKLLDVLRKSGN